MIFAPATLTNIAADAVLGLTRYCAHAEGAQRVVGRDGTRGGDVRVRKRDAQCGRTIRGRTHVTARLGRRDV
ncbi:MAG: hypothetical protein M3P12_04675 [Gemmatimonadota bacterium]|nr:hypothetical protein [Gemmatimonadota bacterium]